MLTPVWPAANDSLRVAEVKARPLSVPLAKPFVIASCRLDVTRSVEVEVVLEGGGARVVGLGEGACLPPVTREDQPDVLRAVAGAAARLVGRPVAASADALDDQLTDLLPGAPVARAAVETAMLDAIARHLGRPLWALLRDGGGPRAVSEAPDVLETDITVSIDEPRRMAEAARQWRARGFRLLKIKVSADADHAATALAEIAKAVPDARLRVDANGGLAAEDAISLGLRCEHLDAIIECWEQPCAAADLDGLARVSTALKAPVVADESVRSLADLERLRGCAAGVNLKLAKMGGVLAAWRIGSAARQAGLLLMAGGMVETRLGMAAAAHVVGALGGVDFVDLDTAWLLREDPYEGGYAGDGPDLALRMAPGLGVARR